MLSRVADCLYWMSRYLERAEHMARLTALRLTAIEQTPEAAAADWRLIFDALNMDPPEGRDDARRLTERFIFDRTNRSSMFNCIAEARANARQVREHISGEMWEQINRQYLRLRASRADKVWAAEPVDFFNAEIDALFLFYGLTSNTLSRGESWHFMQLGRHLERLQLMARLTDLHMARDGSFDGVALLKMGAAFEAYCRVNTAVIRPAAVVEFLALDPNFPRSIRFSADAIATRLAAIAPKETEGRRSRLERMAGQLVALLDCAEANEVLGEGLHPFLDHVQLLGQGIHDQLYAAYIDYPVEDHRTQQQ